MNEGLTIRDKEEEQQELHFAKVPSAPSLSLHHYRGPPEVTNEFDMRVTPSPFFFGCVPE